MSDPAFSGQIMGLDAQNVASASASKKRAVERRLSARIARIDDKTDFSALTFDMLAGVFQRPQWLSAWFSTIGAAEGIEGYWVSIVNNDGATVLAMPFVRRIEDGLSIIEAPNLGVSDYNAPLLASEAGRRLPPARVLWRLIRGVLPASDLVRVERMPELIAQRRNPLIEYAWTLPCRLSGWVVELPRDWNEYLAQLSPKMREKLRKSNSRFDRQPETSRSFAQTGSEASALLMRLNALQKNRICGKGIPYVLDDARVAAFYDVLARGGIAAGTVKMAALKAGDEAVSVGFGIQAPGETVLLRLSNCFGIWAPFSLGLLVTEHMIRAAHAAGQRRFDFGIGEYEFKKRFGARRVSLVDVVIPRSAAGLAHVLMQQVRRRLSQIGWLRRLVVRKRVVLPTEQD